MLFHKWCHYWKIYITSLLWYKDCLTFFIPQISVLNLQMIQTLGDNQQRRGSQVLIKTNLSPRNYNYFSAPAANIWRHPKQTKTQTVDGTCKRYGCKTTEAQEKVLLGSISCLSKADVRVFSEGSWGFLISLSHSENAQQSSIQPHLLQEFVCFPCFCWLIFQ